MQQDSFEVIGSKRLKGTLRPQGAKNEALQVLCAVLMTDQKVRLNNLPDIVDVQRLISLLDGLGVKIDRIDKNTYEFQADNLDLAHLDSPEFRKHASRIRGSVMLMGALLPRFKKVYIPRPGGDKIGRRRLDTHFKGFQQLGADFKFNKEESAFYLEAQQLKGAFLWMEEISVTGTANMVMASVLAEGKTTIYNAACEPYVTQLCKMLIGMGANISGVGSNLLIIEGVSSLAGTEHTLLPDMIEIGSFIGLAAITQSEILIENARPKELGIIPNTFRKLGITIEEKDNGLFIPHQDLYEIQSFIDGSILTIYDAPWPGFTPDLMSIILVTAIQAQGSVLIHQKMFESRLFFVDKLIDMGARIILCDPHRATVIGLERKHKLRGITMTSPDIRAGVSLLIAALSAEGKSVINNINQIDRGYEDIDLRLQTIGAEIKRV